ncbi:MAG: peptidylprolyl isomerase [Flavobacteriaceae bacterium]|nr:peptidylprolyl isomerase [Flavobacteriaceae bacterium]|tara:strand:+ start:12230 stop:12919 length:690 start_codon:yes stop_codon:yes gene_type:complete
MFKSHSRLLLIFIFFISCDVKQKQTQLAKVQEKKEKIITETKKKEKPFLLNDKNAIPFFFEYEKKNKEKKVRIKTKYGNIDIELFEETLYHRSNFIYLTKKKYFNGTYFHRVVKDFIIQGGNSDSYEISKRRRNIGRYLLPPDTKKGFKHHRGIVSVPSSDIENPYKLASPYEFFIVQSKNGAYHLDKNFTPFGKVIKGMEVVDIISNLETDRREWPHENVKIEVELLD